MARQQRVGGAARVAASFELRGRTRACAGLISVQGKDVLDIGCSFGWYCRHATEAGAKSVVGIDTNKDGLSVASEYAPAASFTDGSALELPFDDEQFDVATMFDVIEHVPSGTEVRALREARRVLRRGGRLALSTPGRAWFATYSDPAFYLGHRHYRIGDLVELFRVSQLDIVEIRTAGGVFDQLDLLLYYAARHVAGRERHPADFIRRRADTEWRDRSGSNTVMVIAARLERQLLTADSG